MFKRNKDNIPPVGKINFGDFSRLKPISEDWGFGRGGAIDRYYIESFLKKHSKLIKGDCLEIKDDNYLNKFGSNKITHRDILDIDSNNPKATVFGDLANAHQLTSNTYDCFVLTQTLQLIFDLNSAIKHIYRILKPGGSLLLTLPGISHFPYNKDAPVRYWSFTESSVRRLLEDQFNKNNIQTEVFGNVKVVASFLYGLGVNELTKEDYEYQDPNYQLIIAAKAIK